MMPPKPTAHTSATLGIWRRLRDLKSREEQIVLDGNNLDIASIIAVARHGVKPTISSDEELAKQLDLSVDTLAEYLTHDWVVYGVNTGFGGSADTRTNQHIDLQTHLLQFIQSGIITAADKDPANNWEREPSRVMPPSWIRATIVTRANQNLRGHSAIRKCVLDSLLDLLHNDIIPMVPLRGTISASGDLMPMSYIAGAITGNPDVFVQMGKGSKTKVVPASQALQESGLSASGLGPKEGLGLINGTAPSVAVASMVLYDTQQLAVLSQMLTAFASECLAGNVEWAQPFCHDTRPHPGQSEVATNIRHFLKGSQFVVGLTSRKKTGEGLCQDRYSTRTAPQWVGPYLEDLLLAQEQLEVELNSTSDNPIVDTSKLDDEADGAVYSGGNFQAASVTSAMDKARMSIQMIGRMLWSQVTEIINPVTNNGLEANLNASDRENYTMKGIDINMSAYMSELAALAAPVSAHVMSAEMHNQGINSLALISARRTMEAVDLLAHMSACHLFVSCQAVDLRANHKRFLSKLREMVTDTTPKGALNGLGLSTSQIETLSASLFPIIEDAWYQANTNCWKDRVTSVVKSVTTPITEFLVTSEHECSVADIIAFKKSFQSIVSEAAEGMFYPGPVIPTEEVAAQLGQGSAQLYNWVRSTLNVPLHRGLKDDPLYNAQKGLPTEGKKSVGSWVSTVYESLLKGGMMEMVMDGLDGYTANGVSNGVHKANGTNGVHSTNGTNGVHNTNGTNGVHNTNGTNGVHGVNGINVVHTNGTNDTNGIKC